MKVVKPGLVHEYVNFDCVSHCEAHIACLEALDPIAGQSIRAKANNIVAKFGSIRSRTHELQRECSVALDRVGPTGLYFGIPSVNSNMAGFWPEVWIEGATARNPKGVPDSVARALGNVVLQSRTAIRWTLLSMPGAPAKALTRTLRRSSPPAPTNTTSSR
ncbi:hypothetical protein [Polaromonas sp. JS666]|uniref:hypothetical protein n=1 Tax=Polaromonas sp. (strain JS666 / ATCC BAA-500) TaxID=296591 RepID=UPI0012EEE0A5|nr:hypothetical protein [Polaromonas sp. JS666]